MPCCSEFLYRVCCNCLRHGCFFFFFSSRRRHTRLVSDWSFRRVLFRSLPSHLPYKPGLCAARRRPDLLTCRFFQARDARPRRRFGRISRLRQQALLTEATASSRPLSASRKEPGTRRQRKPAEQGFFLKSFSEPFRPAMGMKNFHPTACLSLRK